MVVSARNKAYGFNKQGPKGDWKRTVEENPMATFIANEVVRLADEPLQDTIEPPGRGSVKGQAGGVRHATVLNLTCC